MTAIETIPIKDNGFEYLGKHYDCQFAIKRDVKMILQEAEISHKDTFDELYDRNTLSDIGGIIFVLSPLVLVILFYLRFKDSKFK